MHERHRANRVPSALTHCKGRFPFPRLFSKFEVCSLRQPRDRTGLFTLIDHLIYASEPLAALPCARAGLPRQFIPHICALTTNQEANGKPVLEEKLRSGEGRCYAGMGPVLGSSTCPDPTCTLAGGAQEPHLTQEGAGATKSSEQPQAPSKPCGSSSRLQTRCSSPNSPGSSCQENRVRP